MASPITQAIESDICRMIHACSERMKRFVANRDKKRLCGLTLNQIEILHYVGGKKEVLQQDIVKDFSISKSLASQSISRLVQKGYLKKQRAKDDSRNFRIIATAKLRKLYSSINQIEEKHFVPALKNLPHKDKQSLLILLNAVFKELSEQLS